MNNAFVYDTYALLEIIDGNPRYERYEEGEMVITEFILAELCFNLIRRAGEGIAFKWVDELSTFVIPVNKEIIKRAMRYKFERLRDNLSMADCVGYFLAKEMRIKFLTGDKQFRDFEDVEFVK